MPHTQACQSTFPSHWRVTHTATLPLGPPSLPVASAPTLPQTPLQRAAQLPPRSLAGRDTPPGTAASPETVRQVKSPPVPAPLRPLPTVPRAPASSSKYRAASPPMPCAHQSPFLRPLRHQKRNHSINSNRRQRQSHRREKRKQRRVEPRPLCQFSHSLVHRRNFQRSLVHCSNFSTRPIRHCLRVPSASQRHKRPANPRFRNPFPRQIKLRPGLHSKPVVLHISRHADHRPPWPLQLDTYLLIERIAAGKQHPRQRFTQNHRIPTGQAIFFPETPSLHDGNSQSRKIPRCDAAIPHHTSRSLRETRTPRHFHVRQYCRGHAPTRRQRIACRQQVTPGKRPSRASTSSIECLLLLRRLRIRSVFSQHNSHRHHALRIHSGGAAASFHKIRSSNPAPASSTSDTAICAVTSNCLSHPRLVGAVLLPVRLSASTLCSAGTSPNSIPHTSDAPSAKSNTRRSRLACCNRRILPPAQWTQTPVEAHRQSSSLPRLQTLPTTGFPSATAG